jgi:hypothetical protein
MIPNEVEINDNGKKSTQRIYLSIPNLVYRWTDKGPVRNSDAPLADPKETTAVPVAAAQLPDELKRLRSHMSQKMGSLFEVEPATVDKSWRIQNGTEFDLKTSKLTKNKSGKLLVDSKYHELLRTCQPYTDEKGYELVGPYPLGRWLSLEEALKHITEGGRISDNNNPGISDAEAAITTRVTDASTAFVFAGLGKPTAFTDANLDIISSAGADIASPYLKAFELDYSFDSPEKGNNSPEDPKAAPQAQEPKEKSFADKVEAMLDSFHNFANGGSEGDRVNKLRHRYKGRLGALVDDTGFHPLDDTLGNSNLATLWSDSLKNWVGGLGTNSALVKWISE